MSESRCESHSAFDRSYPCMGGESLRLACGSEIKIFSATCSWELAGEVEIPVCHGKVGDQMVRTMRHSGCGGVVVKKRLVSAGEFIGKHKLRI